MKKFALFCPLALEYFYPLHKKPNSAIFNLIFYVLKVAPNDLTYKTTFLGKLKMFLNANFLKIGHNLAEIHGIFQNCLKYLRSDQNSKAQKWHK